jgi:hypothetical protein
MTDVTLKATDAKQHYLDQEYPQASSLLEDVLDEMESLLDEALRLKDQALVWIYLIEWMTVTGVFLVAGFTLWTLMVRRRLYREVAVTRVIE